jgi:HSP20 family protein
MAIQRWDPLQGLMDLQQKMNHLFEDTLARSGDGNGVAGEAPSSAWKPPVDLHEEDDAYVLRTDLPGVSVDEVEIRVEGGALHLLGERRMEGAVARDAYLRVERPYGRFGVQVALPPSVDPDQIRATHHNGVIEVRLPKRRPRSASRIEIKPR